MHLRLVCRGGAHAVRHRAAADGAAGTHGDGPRALESLERAQDPGQPDLPGDGLRQPEADGGRAAAPSAHRTRAQGAGRRVVSVTPTRGMDRRPGAGYCVDRAFHPGPGPPGSEPTVGASEHAGRVSTAPPGELPPVRASPPYLQAWPLRVLSM